MIEERQRYRLHPFVGNDRRAQFLEDLEPIFGPKGDRWTSSSNYDYSYRNSNGSAGTFDIYLKDEQDVVLFMMMFPDTHRLAISDSKKLHTDANPQLALFEW